jgi:hypothetical protein
LTWTAQGLSFPNQVNATLLTPVRDTVGRDVAGRPAAIDTRTVHP